MRILFLLRNGLIAYVPILLILSSLCTSCGNTRNLVYMQGKFDTAKLSEVPYIEPVIQKGDLISIIVYSDNPAATAIYNQELITSQNSGAGASSSNNGSANAGVTNSTQASPTTPGYPVDEHGNIQFQGLGTLHVEGLTRTMLTDTLNARLSGYLKNPYYSIRFLNYRFTMLGEINKPSIYSIPGDRISILEALGMAGDMTFYGRRDNVLVIRTTNGKREFGRLDLTKPDIMASPYFYIQQNDVVIFEPSKKKIAATDQTVVRNITIASVIISTFAILYSIFK